MTLETIRTECAEHASALQPFVDAELGEAEAQKIAEHLDACEPCRAAVQEQVWVRGTLRGLETERAPADLRARISIALREEQTHRRASAPGRWSRPLRWLGRTSIVLVPAGALAAVWLVGLSSQQTSGAPRAAAAWLSTNLPALARGAAAQPFTEVTGSNTASRKGASTLPKRRPPTGRPGLELLEAKLAHGEPAVSGVAQLRYRVFRSGIDTGIRLLHQSSRKRRLTPRGTPVLFDGDRYWLDHRHGQQVVRFERQGLSHTVGLEDARRIGGRQPASPGDFSELLHLAAQIGANDPHPQPGASPDLQSPPRPPAAAVNVHYAH